MVLHDLSCLQCLPLAAPVSSESSANAITSERGSPLLTALAGAGSGSPTLMDLSEIQCTQNNAFHFAMLYILEFLLSLFKSPCNPNDTDFSLTHFTCSFLHSATFEREVSSSPDSKLLLHRSLKWRSTENTCSLGIHFVV